MNVELRRVSSEDYDALGTLFTDSSTHPFIIDNGPLSADAILERLDRMQDRSLGANSHYWSIIADDRPVGYVALHNTGDDLPAISYAVLPAQRRRGIARKALRELFETARTAYGKTGIWATTHLDNQASSALLIDIGFRQGQDVETPQGTRRSFSYTLE